MIAERDTDAMLGAEEAFYITTRTASTSPPAGKVVGPSFHHRGGPHVLEVDCANHGRMLPGPLGKTAEIPRSGDK
ncbi:hypothetical protein [Nonomuraea basaltis]|uniref:hypothetical protein n=1 Tax=Nonomuraea basaltis TaxID=2495887 RepID=UPI0014871A00|nr:hypothetical protein [Nonomuraea basaltis]